MSTSSLNIQHVYSEDLQGTVMDLKHIFKCACGIQNASILRTGLAITHTLFSIFCCQFLELTHAFETASLSLCLSLTQTHTHSHTHSPRCTACVFSRCTMNHKCTTSVAGEETFNRITAKKKKKIKKFRIRRSKRKSDPNSCYASLLEIFFQ